MEKIDLQDFYEEVSDFIPNRIEDEWLAENEEYLKELLFCLFQTYDKSKDCQNYKVFLKLYSEILTITYQNFKVGYF